MMKNERTLMLLEILLIIAVSVNIYINNTIKVANDIAFANLEAIGSGEGGDSKGKVSYDTGEECYWIEGNQKHYGSKVSCEEGDGGCVTGCFNLREN